MFRPSFEELVVSQLQIVEELSVRPPMIRCTQKILQALAELDGELEEAYNLVTILLNKQNGPRIL